MKMRVAMKREQIGSAISQPNCSTRTEDMITPTLPMVSASTCRNTPVEEREVRVHDDGL